MFVFRPRLPRQVLYLRIIYFFVKVLVHVERTLTPAAFHITRQIWVVFCWFAKIREHFVVDAHLDVVLCYFVAAVVGIFPG